MAGRTDALLTADALIGTVSRQGRDRLAAAGCDTARLDAELLLASVLGVPRARLILDRDRPVPASDLECFESLLTRRIAREPVAYILGVKDFRRLTLTVDRRVLIPRPETELLVEIGLELAGGARVLDVGTGSGAVALALKDERPDLVVRGTDVAAPALAVARANRDRLALDVGLDCADLWDGDDRDGHPDAILANLPYIPDGTALAPEIAGYEPAGALFAGPDGLDAVRRLIAAVATVTRPLPLLALEIGDCDQAAATAALMRAAGYGEVEVRIDLAGSDRVVVGRE